MRMLLRLALVFLTTLTALPQTSDTKRADVPQKAANVNSADDMEEIAEVVFRWQFFWNKQRKVCFLLLDGKEPSEKLMRRFTGQTDPRIQKSEHKKRDKYERLIDAETGEIAEIISIGPITWISKDRVDVRSNVYDGDVIEIVHRLIRKDGKWSVEDWRDLEWDKSLPKN